MFRIGEFAQIAQVSSRQLRFYDQLGLLHPARADNLDLKRRRPADVAREVIQ